ncbi:copia-type polyprotein [Cucumis melo var. makuwa]|uniref:Copia-type polyprotein n=1 Tax=Cucumis melo var. makuwa TaxID=1194695 RepID=A0A5A7T8M9_CUCMM|nr:copia-type polyprotein [Cucumis melo var. makuwa]
MTEQLFQSKLKLKDKEDSLEKGNRGRGRGGNHGRGDFRDQGQGSYGQRKFDESNSNSNSSRGRGRQHYSRSSGERSNNDRRVEENANYAEKGEESSDSSLFLACKGAKTCENSAWLSSWQTIKEEFSTRIKFESKETTRVYFVKENSEVFGMFKRFKALVEKESGYYIKALRSDMGSEFTSNEFKTFCAENGIHRPMTVPFTTQQNCVVERKNRTILHMARSMLKCKKMPKKFWAQAVECVVYMSNRSPTRSLWKKTPQQAWKGRKPSIGHLRVFGCMAYAHIPDQKRGKLDDKSEKNVFVGYDASSKGYKLYNHVTKKTIVSRDVVFDEEASWNWNDEPEDYKFLLFPDDHDEPSDIASPPTPLTSPITPQQSTSSSSTSSMNL